MLSICLCSEVTEHVFEPRSNPGRTFDAFRRLEDVGDIVRIENLDRAIGQIGWKALVAQHLTPDRNIGTGAGNDSVEFGFGQEVGEHAGGTAGAQKHMMAFGRACFMAAIWASGTTLWSA